MSWRLKIFRSSALSAMRKLMFNRSSYFTCCSGSRSPLPASGTLVAQEQIQATARSDAHLGHGRALPDRGLSGAGKRGRSFLTSIVHDLQPERRKAMKVRKGDYRSGLLPLGMFLTMQIGRASCRERV